MTFAEEIATAERVRIAAWQVFLITFQASFPYGHRAAHRAFRKATSAKDKLACRERKTRRRAGDEQ